MLKKEVCSKVKERFFNYISLLAAYKMNFSRTLYTIPKLTCYLINYLKFTIDAIFRPQLFNSLQSWISKGFS